MLPQSYANTRISEGPAKSRADGVTIVLGPMYILRFSRMAERTSSSQTKSTGFGAGGAGGLGTATSIGHSVASQPYPPDGEPAPRRARKRSTTLADTLAAGGWVEPQEHEWPSAAFAGADAVPGEPDAGLGEPAAMPREAR